MSRLIFILAAGILGYLFWYEYKRREPQDRKRFLMQSGFWVLLGGIVLLVATGRLHWISIAVTAALPVLKGLFGIAVRGLPFLQVWLRNRQQPNQGDGQADGGNQRPSVDESQMTTEEAWQLLGLEPGASEKEIVQAHKKLMQKLHPDRGGNDYLAAKLNAARDLLLKH